MSKYAYCCIATQLINYIKNAQSWLGFDITRDITNLNSIENNIYNKYMKLEELKEQIVNNKTVDITTFSELVSNTTELIDFVVFYNTNFAEKKSNYYSYCNVIDPNAPLPDPEPDPEPDPKPEPEPDPPGIPTKNEFTDVYGAPLNTFIKSERIIISGLALNGRFQLRCLAPLDGMINGFSSSTEDNDNFQKMMWVNANNKGELYVKVAMYSDTKFNAIKTGQFIIGTNTKKWTIQTIGSLNNEFNFSFKSTIDANVNTFYISAPIIINNFNPNETINISATGGTIDAGGEILSGGFSSSRTIKSSNTGSIIVVAKGKSAPASRTGVTITVSINGTIGSYSIITKAPGAGGHGVPPGWWTYAAPGSNTIGGDVAVSVNNH